MKLLVVKPVVSGIAMVLWGGILFAQGTSGTIVGTVRDSSGATVAGAMVTVRNQQTNVARRVITSAEGEYTAPLLQPGTYDVSVEQPGFNKATHRDVRLDVNQTVRLDSSLTLSNQTQQVDVVEAGAPLVQTDTSSLGQVVNQQSVSTLPLNQRNFVSFAFDSRTFGFIQSANAYGGRPPRQIQLGAKLIF